MSTLTIAVRSVLPADEDFLLRVFASTRAAEYTLGIWDEAAWDAFVRMQFKAQSAHYRAHWPNSDHAVIEAHLDGATLPIGRLWVDRRADSIHVLDITLLPEWRGYGIGALCLERLMREAALAAQTLTVQVEESNPARRLYERLGFCCASPQRSLHHWMVWGRSTSASAAASPAARVR